MTTSNLPTAGPRWAEVGGVAELEGRPRQRRTGDAEHPLRQVDARESPRARWQRPQDESGAGTHVEDVANAAQSHEIGHGLCEAAMHGRVVVGRCAFVESRRELRWGLHMASVGRVRLAALFHDIGKPAIRSQFVTFPLPRDIPQ